MREQPTARGGWGLGAALLFAAVSVAAQQPSAPLPSSNLQYGAFTLQFAADGALTLKGQGWPTFAGRWQSERDEVTVTTTGGPPQCAAAGV